MALFGFRKNQERRLNQRWRIDRFLGVFNQDKSVILGRVQDLSLNGMSVLSSEPLAPDSHIKLAVEIVLEDGGTKTLRLRCRRLWSRPVANTGYYQTGFEFSGASPIEIANIERILEEQRLSGYGALSK